MIQMVDLFGQYSRIQKELDEAVLSAIRSCNFINGPEVKSFQKSLEKYLNIKNVIPCANGTDALQIALMSLDLKPGDEVIVPAFTYIATAEVIALLGLKPVWVDVDSNSFNINTELLESLITSKTKVIIPVHLFGQCSDMDPILKLAMDKNLFIIEDTAQALGAKYLSRNGIVKKAGTIGNIGCTSFFPSKNLGCYGDGGAIFSNDNNLSQKIRKISNHGQSVKYFHDVVGVNSRLDTIQASILEVKLKYLEEYNSARLKAANTYDILLKDIKEIEIPFRDSKSSHVFHQYTIKINDGSRDRLKSYLEENHIPAMVYYPVPIHLQKAYLNKDYKKGSFPVSEALCEQVLSLPMHTELNKETQENISFFIHKFYNL